MIINIKDHQDKRPYEPLFKDNMGILAIDDWCRQHMVCAEEEMERRFGSRGRSGASPNGTSYRSRPWPRPASACWNRLARKCSS